jgi:hypothetical protein
LRSAVRAVVYGAVLLIKLWRKSDKEPQTVRFDRPANDEARLKIPDGVLLWLIALVGGIDQPAI